MCGNLRFVITIAKKYQNLGFELKELISEGNMGLMKAVDKFDYSSENIRFLHMLFGGLGNLLLIF